MKNTGKLRQQFIQSGYRCAASSRPEFTMFYRYEGGSVCLIHMIEINRTFEYDAIRLQQTIRNAEQIFRDKGYTSIESHILVITDSLDKSRYVCNGIYGVWYVLEPDNRLLIYEDQPSDFHSIKAITEQILENSTQSYTGFGGYTGEWMRILQNVVHLLGPATVAMVAINVIVFIVLSLMGSTENADFMYMHGAMVPESLYNGEMYRLFTSTFMHFGIRHLAGNMLVLCLMGSMLERNIGKISFIIIYLISGLGGNILSALSHLHGGEVVVSAGASGAIFGVMGALITVVIMNKGNLASENLTTRKILIFAGLSLYQGFSSPGVDNFAHVGGVITGAIVALICIVIKRSRKKSEMRG